MEMSEGDVHQQIAHVFVDLLSLVDESTEEGDAFLAQIELAQERAFELGGLAFSLGPDGQVKVNPGNLMGGAVGAMVALFRVARERTGLSDDELIAEWREMVDD